MESLTRRIFAGGITCWKDEMVLNTDKQIDKIRFMFNDYAILKLGAFNRD